MSWGTGKVGRCHVQRACRTLPEVLGNRELLVLKNSSGQAVGREIVNPDASFSLSMAILILKREVSLKGQTGYMLVRFAPRPLHLPHKETPLKCNFTLILLFWEAFPWKRYCTGFASGCSSGQSVDARLNNTVP
jgi:hypothetical protein